MHLLLDPYLVAQHSLVTRLQAWEAGLSPRQIDHLLTRSLLVPVHRGVFRDPAGPRTMEQRALAAVLACGPGSVVSHRLGVAMVGMRNYDCLLTEVTSPGARRIPGVFSHRSVRPPDQTILRGVPITSAARTIIDVGVLVGAPILRKWLETWVSTKVLSLDDLDAQMQVLKGHAGVPIVRAAMSDRTMVLAAADSPPEAELGLLLATHGLPRLTLHHLVTLPSAVSYELDWCYPEWQIAFEMDGYGVHLRSMEAFENDRHRRNELEAEGWAVLNFTSRMVRRKPATVLDQVQRLIQRRTLSYSPQEM